MLRRRSRSRKLAIPIIPFEPFVSISKQFAVATDPQVDRSVHKDVNKATANYNGYLIKISPNYSDSVNRVNSSQEQYSKKINSLYSLVRPRYISYRYADIFNDLKTDIGPLVSLIATDAPAMAVLYTNTVNDLQTLVRSIENTLSYRGQVTSSDVSDLSRLEDNVLDSLRQLGAAAATAIDASTSCQAIVTIQLVYLNLLLTAAKIFGGIYDSAQVVATVSGVGEPLIQRAQTVVQSLNSAVADTQMGPAAMRCSTSVEAQQDFKAMVTQLLGLAVVALGVLLGAVAGALFGLAGAQSLGLL